MSGETAVLGIGKTVRLPGGRSIGYDEYGKADGPAVFVFHGNPGSHLDVLYAGRAALDSLPVRLIAPDRPGIGLSDPQPHRQIRDWAADVNQLADALGIGRYAVIGGSTGGPFALACARLSPQRITAAGVTEAACRSRRSQNSRYASMASRTIVRPSSGSPRSLTASSAPSSPRKRSRSAA